MDKPYRNKSDAPWVKSSGSFLLLYTILAAVAGLFLTCSFDLNHITTLFKVIIDGTFVASFSIFIYSAELITDALDENDVKKLLVTYLIYNLAVVLLFLGLFLLLYHEVPHAKPPLYSLWQVLYMACSFFILVHVPKKNKYIRYGLGLTILLVGIFLSFHFKAPYFKQNIYMGILMFIFLLFSRKWVKDIGWLLFVSKQDFHDYVKELKGLNKSEQDWGWLITRFYKYRKRFKGEMPEYDFADINIELRPSKISGIGVFSIKKFQKGEVIAEGIHIDDTENIVPWSEVKNVNHNIEKKINDFCIGTPKGFYPPENFDFNTLTTEWYMNHSCNGNIGFNKEGDFMAIRDIELDEELTYDYALAESNPRFKLICNCGTANCRKIVTGNDWENKEIVKDIKQYMHPYLKYC